MNLPSPAGGMPTNPLDQLADIHLPEPVTSFPWAPGWWVLLIVAVVSLVTLIWYGRRRYLALAWRRTALAELDVLTHTADTREFSTNLNQLLRRLAILHYGTDCAGMNNVQWREFLCEEGGPTFTASEAETLLDNCYAVNGSPLDREQVLQKSRDWVKRHCKASRRRASREQEVCHA